MRSSASVDEACGVNASRAACGRSSAINASAALNAHPRVVSGVLEHVHVIRFVRGHRSLLPTEYRHRHKRHCDDARRQADSASR